jgi:hypothetical protein
MTLRLRICPACKSSLLFPGVATGGDCASRERTGYGQPRYSLPWESPNCGQTGDFRSCPVCQLHNMCGTRTVAAGRSRTFLLLPPSGAPSSRRTSLPVGAVAVST